METLLGMALAGAVVTGVVELAKRFNISAKLTMGVLAIIAAGGYVFFTEYATAEAVQLVLSVWGTAVVFYEFIIKKLLSK
tara:strand:+ start:10525 stop:10764 length:240 start_codon:yes stop_codon:yes gene_type:complete